MSNGALHVARTGLDAQNMRMQVIANNLANVNTVGFKRDRASFETLAYQAMTVAGSASSAENKYAIGTNLGTGVQINGTARIDTQGTLTTTGNSLDLAVEGAGYFQVQMPDGRNAYTRAGDFNLSAEGTLVTSDGMPVQPQIQIPQGATAISIGTDGTVSAQVAGQSDVTAIGQLELARFTNSAGLQSIGNNLLLETPASGAPQVGAPGAEGRGGLRSGVLEASNVNVVEELVDMIETQRAYEVNSKMIQATDEMMRNATQTL
ncbi:flagellar basal-body rod protein FlgG [Sphingorhabdus sp.]|uniref:flagellar basal-body rod protein FlgG n=1 Tax=Sphingorhabdus sp. TaxID=1902408 RepID=UPI00398307D4